VCHSMTGGGGALATAAGKEPSSGTSWVPRRMTRARVVDVSVTDDTLTVNLDDGCTISLPIGWFPRLAHGTLDEQAICTLAGQDTEFTGLTG
jgi:hypothetical protein